MTSTARMPDRAAARDKALRQVVRLTPAPERHRLLDLLVSEMKAQMRPVPRSGRCACGARLVPSPRTAEVESYELDYSVGWQRQEGWLDEGGAPAYSCATKRNDQHTLAHVMCQSCHRLYDLPAVWEKTYG